MFNYYLDQLRVSRVNVNLKIYEVQPCSVVVKTLWLTG
jgi:hypothetical protein